MTLYFPVTDAFHKPFQVAKLKIKFKREDGIWKKEGRSVYQA